MQKKGWMKIVEAFVVILLLIGVILIVLSDDSSESDTISEKIYSAETIILREVQLNNTLRAEILELTSVPIESENSSFPILIETTMENRVPNYLECSAKICDLNDSCYLSEYPEEDTYAQSVAITSNLQMYNPRQLKIFCWRK